MKTKKTIIPAIITTIILLSILPACSQQTETAQQTETTEKQTKGISAGGDNAYVRIKDYKFVPKELNIKTGTTVTWTNNDPAPHTIMTSDGNIQSNPLEKGETKTYTFDTPGTYNYICTIHPFMKGTIIVK